MKKNFLVISFIMMSLCAFAQLSVGVRAGLNLNDVNFSNVPAEYEEDTHVNAGFHAGVFLKVGITEKISVVPEIVFTKRGFSREDNPSNQNDRINLNYLEIPILASYAFGKLLSLDLGPTFSYKVSTIAVTDGDKQKLAFGFDKDFELGVSGGLRIHALDRLAIVARYHVGLLPVDEVHFRDANNRDLGTASGFNRNLELGLAYTISSPVD